MVRNGEVHQRPTLPDLRLALLIIALVWFLASIPYRTSTRFFCVDLCIALLGAIVWLRSGSLIKQSITVTYELNPEVRRSFTYWSLYMPQPATEIRDPSGRLLLKLVPLRHKNSWELLVPADVPYWNAPDYIEDHLRMAFDFRERRQLRGRLPSEP